MKLIITGNGLVSKAIQDINNLYGYDISFFDSTSDLRDKKICDSIITSEVDYVIHTASRVGGLGAHKGKHSEFLYDNLLINTNVIEACRKVKKAIFLSSVAAFPPEKTLLKEGDLTGTIHTSEYGYALSKRVMDEQIQLYRKEYDCNFSCVFPVNIYGPNDQFNLEKAHCVAALIHKFYKAIHTNDNVEIWSDGLSIRQFIYSYDLARILLDTLSLEKLPDRLIVSNPEIYNIMGLANEISLISGFKNSIIFNKDRPAGLRARECDISRLLEIMPSTQFTSLKDGLAKTWEWFVNNYGIAKI